MAELLARYLKTVAESEGVFQISPARPFQHDESQYDLTRPAEQLSDATIERQGAAIVGFLTNHGFRPGSPVLEIGCGSGLISVSLARRAEIGHLLVTDPSPAFCRITRDKLAATHIEAASVDTAILRAEDVSLLPPGCISVILLRSVLHHITDVSKFLADCSAILPPGGLLICEEPYYEGYLMMGFLGGFLADALTLAGTPCTPDELRHIDLFVQTMQFYSRSDVDKSQAEDKHLFRPDELLNDGLATGLQLRHFPNWYITGPAAANIANRPGHFQRFFHHYIRYCMQWPPDLCDRTAAATSKYFRYFEPLETESNTTPYCFGTFVFTKL